MSQKKQQPVANPLPQATKPAGKTSNDIYEALNQQGKLLGGIYQLLNGALIELTRIRMTRQPFSKEDIIKWKACLNWVQEDERIKQEEFARQAESAKKAEEIKGNG